VDDEGKIRIPGREVQCCAEQGSSGQVAEHFGSSDFGLSRLG